MTIGQHGIISVSLNLQTILSASANGLQKSSPWIGTFTGTQAGGYAFAGDVSGGIGVALQDFWQAYPSTLEVQYARSQEA